MPFANKSKRQEWERKPSQVESARTRKQRQRERNDKIERLQAVAMIIDRAGPNHSISPVLVAQVEEHREEIVAYWEKRDQECVEVIVEGKRVRDIDVLSQP